MSVLNLPDLGEGLQHAEIVSWHVAVGDHVVTSQPLVAVETDKAVVDVPAPAAGTIARLCAEVGDSVDVGAPLVEFAEGERIDTGTVVGEIKTAAPTSTSKPGTPPTGTGVQATPAVRALARQHMIDLETLRGSGPDGAILSSDVEQAVAATSGAPRERLRGVRRAMAERMTLAHAQVVPASLHADADIEHWPEHSDVTLRVVQAIATACEVEPALNTWLDMENMNRQLHQSVDLGVAVDTADGLFVPTLRDVGARSDESLREGLDQIKQDVLNRSIPPQELRGQTITLSNFGSIGGRYAELVVVPPQVAIVGAGRILSAVLAVDNKPVIHRQLPLSLSFDHRAVTGAEAARFMAAMIRELEN
ncbi:MAG: dihydrolipoamide acetyltransferase family protein [Halieaceae bacterium]